MSALQGQPCARPNRHALSEILYRRDDGKCARSLYEEIQPALSENAIPGAWGNHNRGIADRSGQDISRRKAMKYKPTYADKQREAQKQTKAEQQHSREDHAETTEKKSGAEPVDQKKPPAPKNENAA